MSTQTQHTPFRADVVGSFLRPEELKNARAQLAEGKIDEAELRETEDRLIADLIAKEKAHGIKAITDGEFRRSYWHLDFMWGLNGVEHIELDHGYQFHGEETTKGSVRLSGRISGENHPFVEDFRFVRQFEEDGIVARQTIPAPAQLLAELFRGDNSRNTLDVYPNIAELISDIAAAYRQVIHDLYAAGCRNLQFDDCTWGMFCDTHYWASRQKEGVSIEEEALKYLRVNNLALEGRPADLTVTSHICRGNYHSTYACEGSYDPVAPYVFAQEHVDAFYLEYDDHRSGGFGPLKFIPEGTKVVLGLVTTKAAGLEDKAAIISRIREAEQYVPLDRLYLSPQCGFASCEIGNKLTEEEQWAKVDLVQEIAREVWGES
ncbi:MAG: 5-methyltetrahydropteroyltriglutamate--homocysteine S-methyltransferase [Prevotella sp.]|nr:5-methyltetrahydropteroyltriglutamate--homocysteine S-methyltransferase [Prevotella sp.]